jgi:prevent-host-death family protein
LAAAHRHNFLLGDNLNNLYTKKESTSEMPVFSSQRVRISHFRGHLREYIEQAAAGSRVVIHVSGSPVAALVSLADLQAIEGQPSHADVAKVALAAAVDGELKETLRTAWQRGETATVLVEGRRVRVPAPDVAHRPATGEYSIPTAPAMVAAEPRGLGTYAAHLPGKYAPLREWLSGRSEDLLTLEFEQIERILGCELPASARRYKAWWSGSPAASATQVQKRSWTEAGYRVVKVEPAAGVVVFERKTGER